MFYNVLLAAGSTSNPALEAAIAVETHSWWYYFLNPLLLPNLVPSGYFYLESVLWILLVIGFVLQKKPRRYYIRRMSIGMGIAIVMVGLGLIVPSAIILFTLPISLWIMAHAPYVYHYNRYPEGIGDQLLIIHAILANVPIAGIFSGALGHSSRIYKWLFVIAFLLLCAYSLLILFMFRFAASAYG